MHRNAYANAKRDFRWKLPFTLKGGLDVRQSMRDYRGGAATFTFVGPDGRAASGDENARPVPRSRSTPSRDGVFGFPKTQRLRAGKLWDFYQANPQSFTKVDNTIYRSAVQLSQHAEEIISVRAICAAMWRCSENRLKLTGGVRAEQTNIKAEGPLTDPTLNYQRAANGTVIDGNANRRASSPP